MLYINPKKRLSAINYLEEGYNLRLFYSGAINLGSITPTQKTVWNGRVKLDDVSTIIMLGPLWQDTIPRLLCSKQSFEVSRTGNYFQILVKHRTDNPEPLLAPPKDSLFLSYKRQRSPVNPSSSDDQIKRYWCDAFDASTASLHSYVRRDRSRIITLLTLPQYTKSSSHY